VDLGRRWLRAVCAKSWLLYIGTFGRPPRYCIHYYRIQNTP
jgi:hypothetical protein